MGKVACAPAKRPAVRRSRSLNAPPADPGPLFRVPDPWWTVLLVRDAGRVAAAVCRFQPRLRPLKDDLECVALCADVDQWQSEPERLRTMRRTVRRYVNDNMLGQVWSLDLPTPAGES